MSGGFSNPIIGGGGALVYPSIHSPNFVLGTAGWSINKDGTASFTGLNLFGGKQLIYHPSGGAGNLIQSIAEVGGTDTYGNVYLAGNTSYRPVVGGFEAAQNFGGALTWYTAPSEAGPWTAVGFILPFGSAPTTVMELATPPGGTLLLQPTQAIIRPSGDMTGATDWAAITAAHSAGQAVQLVPGTYYINKPLDLPSWAVLDGTGAMINNSFIADQLTTIKVVAAFTSALAVSAAIAMIGAGGGSPVGGQDITNVHFDLSSAPASVDGITGYSQVDGVHIDNVSVYKATGVGMDCIYDGVSGQPDGWRIRGLMLSQSASFGAFFQAADFVMDDVHIIGGGTHGFEIKNLTNSIMTSCRSANNGGSGYHHNGGSTIGYLKVNGCTSDSNQNHGWFADAVGSTGCINLTGFSSYNDGLAAANTYAAVRYSASTAPMVINGLSSTLANNSTGVAYGFDGSGSTGTVMLNGLYSECLTSALHGTSNGNFSWRNVSENIALAGTDFVADANRTPWISLPYAGTWGTGPAALALQYRLNGDAVEVIGQVLNSVAQSGTSSLTGTALPAPLHEQRKPVVIQTSTGAPGYPDPNIDLTSGGALSLQNLPAGTTEVQFHAFFSLTA